MYFFLGLLPSFLFVSCIFLAPYYKKHQQKVVGAALKASIPLPFHKVRYPRTSKLPIGTPLACQNKTAGPGKHQHPRHSQKGFVPVQVVDMLDNSITTYKSVSEASRMIGVSAQRISNWRINNELRGKKQLPVFKRFFFFSVATK